MFDYVTSLDGRTVAAHAAATNHPGSWRTGTRLVGVDLRTQTHTPAPACGQPSRVGILVRSEELGVADAGRVAWVTNGAIIVAPERETVVAVSDMLAPERPEVQTAEDQWYHGRLRNHGWIFLGSRATVAARTRASPAPVTCTPPATPRIHGRAVRSRAPCGG